VLLDIIALMLKMVSVFVHSVLLALKPVHLMGQLHAVHVLLAHTTTIAIPTQRALYALLVITQLVGALHALHVLLAHTTTIAIPTQRALTALLVPSQGPENRVALTALLVELTLQQADFALTAMLAHIRVLGQLHALHVLLAHTTTIACPTQRALHALLAKCNLVQVLKRVWIVMALPSIKMKLGNQLVTHLHLVQLEHTRIILQVHQLIKTVPAVALANSLTSRIKPLAPHTKCAKLGKKYLLLELYQTNKSVNSVCPATLQQRIKAVVPHTKCA